jgi:hypothetical protein
MLCEYGEPRWNDIDREKLLIRPPELWKFYQQSSDSGTWNMAKEFMNFANEVSLSVVGFFNMK